MALEVDNTTDVRRGNLGLYESWGIPELCVEVPDKQSPRPRSLRPGLTIYARRKQLSRGARQPRLPGLDGGGNPPGAERGRNDAGNHSVLRRVGRAMGEAEGTGLDDDMISARGAPGSAHGRGRGRACQMLRAILTQALESRSIPATPAILKQLARIDGASAAAAAAAMQAALTCRQRGRFPDLAQPDGGLSRRPARPRGVVIMGV